MHRSRIIKNHEKDLTIIDLYGKVFLKDAMDVMNAIYQSEVTSNLICFLNRCDLSFLTREDLSFIAKSASEFANLHTGAKLAFVCKDDLNFGLLRMYATLAEIENNPNNSRVYRSAVDAFKWLHA